MRHIVQQLIQSFFLIIGVLVLVFFMVRVTGDPAALMVSRDATPEQLEAFREAKGLNRPLHEQFVAYMVGVAQGDLGDSLSFNVPALDLIFQRLPATFELAFTTLFVILLVSIPLGVLGGMYPGSPVDWLARGVGLVGQAVPSFWLAMILILVFAVNLRLLPSFGRDSAQSIILPTLALALGGIGQLTRLTRSVVLELRSEHFVRTAHSKGVLPRNIALRHIAPNAALPLVSIVGIQFTYLLGGSVYIETVFSWPGLGSLLNDAINSNDFPLIQAITIFLSLFAIGVNLLTDTAYTLLDPRVRFA